MTFNEAIRCNLYFAAVCAAPSLRDLIGDERHTDQDRFVAQNRAAPSGVETVGWRHERGRDAFDPEDRDPDERFRELTSLAALFYFLPRIFLPVAGHFTRVSLT